MRKLASIQKIKELVPIEDADNIELAKVLGWQCVVKKGEFKPGDLCVYFEIDSFLPVKPEFEFLRASSYKNSELLGEGFRLKTKKMRGQISQGLCIPLNAVYGLFNTVEGMNYRNLEDGDDVTNLLGVRKWEIPEMATTGGTTIGSRPWFIPKSEEVRIQNVPDIISDFSTHPYYITTKMDGSSHAIGLDENNEFYVCGHNYRYADDEKSAFYEYVKKSGFEEKLREYKLKNNIQTIGIIGEFCGGKIQNNRLKLKEPEWYAFTVQIDNNRVGLDKLREVVAALKCKMVPVEETGDNFMSKYSNVDTLLKRAEGEYPNGGPKEGIVIRTIEPIYSKKICGPLSFKVINNKYLLKNGG